MKQSEMLGTSGPYDVRFEVRRVASTKGLEVAIYRLLFVPFLYEVSIQCGGSLDEIRWMGTGDVETV